MLDRQLMSLEKAFVQEGELSERMVGALLKERSGQKR